MLKNLTLIFAFLFTADASIAATSQTVDLGQTTATLVVAQESIAPNSELLAGVHIKLQPHWHTYTYNPGDSGIPSTIAWTLPQGFQASDIYWPPHETFNEAGLTTYGFSDEVVFTTLIKVPETIEAGNVIKAKAEYLVCKDICIPQTAEFEISLPRGDGEQGSDATLLTAWHKKSQLAPADHHIGSNDTDVHTQENVPVYPLAASEVAPTNQTSDTPLVTAMLLALLGGIILNLMPCVFPVLSLKALAIAKHAELSPSIIKKEGIAYTLGVLTCFWVLAGLLIIFQQSGAAIGWGFQFQNPGFVAIMAMVFLFIGLNLSGLFELPVLLGSLATRWGAADSLKGSYATGLLAALVATPCTAPFMATAIGAALSHPPYFALAVFTALGFGLALPFLLLSYAPRLRHLLPASGPWMLTFKHVLAFPMYLSAVWLLWVVGTQTGILGMSLVLVIAICISFLFWAKCYKFSSRYCQVAMLFVIFALLFTLSDGLTKLQQSHMKNVAMQTDDIAYSKEKLKELRDAGTPVFLDATASWCITCQVNKATAIHSEQVQQAFKRNGVKTMVADWTNKDAVVTELLASFGYKGVPLYLYYAPEKDAVVLPQILTPQIIVNQIEPNKE